MKLNLKGRLAIEKKTHCQFVFYFFLSNWYIINIHFSVNKIESLESVPKSGRIETRALQKTIKAI